MAPIEVPPPPLAIFRSAGRDPLAQALSCTGAGMQRIATRLSGRRLDSYAAVLVDEGEGWLESEAAGRIRIVAPTLFWLFPGDRHGYGPDPETAWHEHWVLFHGTLADAFVGSFWLMPTRPAVMLERAADFAALFTRIRRELGEGTPAALASAALGVHQLVIEAKRAADRRDGATTEPTIRAIAAEIRDRAFEAIDFEALARRHAVSPATLRRHMLAAFGVAPKGYQLQIRLDRAKALLAFGDLRVEAIAAAVGFDDAYYFSRLFHKREGLSPSAFRAANRRA